MWVALRHNLFATSKYLRAGRTSDGVRERAASGPTPAMVPARTYNPQEVAALRRTRYDRPQQLVARTVTALGLVGMATIHILELPTRLSDQAYVGWLFSPQPSSRVCCYVGDPSPDERFTCLDACAGSSAARCVLDHVALLSVAPQGCPDFTDYKGVSEQRRGLESMVVEGLVVLVSGAVLATRTAMARQPAECGIAAGRPATPAPPWVNLERDVRPLASAWGAWPTGPIAGSS